MTSSLHSTRKQFTATFAKTLKKNAFHTVALFLFMFVTLNAYNVIEQIDALVGPQGYSYGIERLQFCIATPYSDPLQIAIVCMILGISSILLSVYNFRFMHTKKSVNVYYSLGIRRSTLFAGKFFGCVVTQLIAVALPFLLCGLHNVAVYGSSDALWLAVFYYMACALAVALYPFAMCVLCMTFSGSTIESLLCGGLLTFLPSALYYGTYLMSESLLAGSLFDASISLKGHPGQWVESTFGGNFTFLDFLYPVVNYQFGDAMSLERGLVYASLPSWGYPILYLGAFAALAVVAHYSFIHMKTEKAAFLGTCPKMIAVTLFGIGSIVIPVNFLMAREYGLDLIVTSLLSVLYLAVAFGLYVGIIAILLRSKEKIKKQLPTAGVMTAGLLVFILIFATGGFGYEKRIPDTEKVEAAGIVFKSAQGLAVQDGGYGYYGDNSDSYRGYDEKEQAKNFLQSYLWLEEIWSDDTFVYFEEEQSIDTIRNIHDLLIHDRRNSLGTTYRGTVFVSYKLKNGNELTRVYNHLPQEAMYELQKLVTAKGYRDASAAEVRDYAVNNSHTYLFSKNCTAMTQFVLEKDDYNMLNDLHNAIVTDIESGRLPLNFKSETSPMGYIGITHNNMTEAYQKKLVREPVYDFGGGERYLLVPVFESMTDTLSVLTQTQKLQYFEDIAKPHHVRVYENPLNNASEQERFSYQFDTLQFSGFVSSNAYYGEDDIEMMFLPESSVLVTDEQTIEEICNQTNFTYFVNEPGYFVQMSYVDAEGNPFSDALVYVPADKMPTILK